MRWIFFVLLGANILLLGWQLMFAADPADGLSSANRPDPDVPQIMLAREAEQGASLGVSRQEPSSRPLSLNEAVSAGEGGNPDAGPASRQPLCTFVGPFAVGSEADQLIERLAAMDIPAQATDVEIPAGPGYWVYLEPLESRREALRRLSELQSQGIDSYIIPKGELMNGISLGMFSKEPLAHARVEQVAELGVEAKLDTIERSIKELWVSIPHAFARRLSEQAWERLLDDTDSTDRRQNFCLHVASQDNFH